MSAPGVTVRMYNVGFGDSFLLTFPCEGGSRKVLIDCGRHSSSKGEPKLQKVVDQILKDVTEAGKDPRIDVVVATHRHQDHVSGFANAAWQKVDVGEVWMPWTEDPDDPEATRIRELQSSTARRIHAAFTRLGLAGSEVDLAANSLTNAKAMGRLHRGFKRRPRDIRFLPSRRRPDATFEPPVLPGVRIHAMGPSRDPEVIRDMNPPVGQSYVALLEAMAMDRSVPNDAAAGPFGSTWGLSPGAVSKDPDLAHLLLTDAELSTLADGSALDPLGVAVQLEKAVNGTSLMLMFEMDAALLLFPGDAQWGTWQAVLRDPHWRRLLERTTFYKVSHHGSHNGTPPEFVDGILGAKAADVTSTDVAAMVSTRPIARWPEIPRKPLLQALARNKARVVRSDDPQPMSGFTFSPDRMFTETSIPLAGT